MSQAKSTSDSPGSAPSIHRRSALLWLLFLYPMLSSLWRQGYPLLSPEVALLVVSTSVLSLLLAWLLSKAPPLLFTGVLLLLLVSVVSIKLFQFDLVSIVVMLVVAVAALFLRERFEQLLLVVLPVMIVGAWLDAQLTSRVAEREVASESPLGQQAPVVHIILDGFIGLDGLPETPAARQFRSDLLAFFSTHGFEVWPRAYSRYGGTLDTMERALNFEVGNAPLSFTADLLGEPMALSRNRWFEWLQAQGYAVRVVQTEGVDFCTAAPGAPLHCLTFPTYDLASVHESDIGVMAKSEALLKNLLRHSRPLDEARQSLGNLYDVGCRDFYRATNGGDSRRVERRERQGGLRTPTHSALSAHQGRGMQHRLPDSTGASMDCLSRSDCQLAGVPGQDLRAVHSTGAVCFAPGRLHDRLA